MHLSHVSLALVAFSAFGQNALGKVIEERGTAQFTQGEPIDANGKGGPILGMSSGEIS